MHTPNSRNRYDRKDSLELGQKSEALFAEMAKQRGWKVTTASRAGNIEEHYDYEVSQNGVSYRVDVKSRKRIARGDAEMQDERIWVELKSVRNTKGWLFGGADLIAFETQAGFKIVKRKDLVKVVNDLVDFKFRAETAADALYKIYSRANRPDQIVQIKISDLDSILWEEWLTSSS